MRENLVKKGLVVGVAILFVATAIVPVVSAQFTKLNAIKEVQKVGKNDGSENDIATIYIKRYDPEMGKLVNEPLKEIPLDEAEQLKEDLESIWKNNCSIDEKLKQEIFLLENKNMLPSDFSVENFTTFIEYLVDGNATSKKPSKLQYDNQRNFFTNYISINGFLSFGPTLSAGFGALFNWTWITASIPTEYVNLTLSLGALNAFLFIIMANGYTGSLGLTGLYPQGFTYFLTIDLAFIGLWFGIAAGPAGQEPYVALVESAIYFSVIHGFVNLMPIS